MWSCKFRKFGKPINVLDKSIVFDIVYRFAGNNIPSGFDFTSYKNALIIPESPNYPGVDFLIWDLEDETLLVFQIAISKLNDRKNADNFTKGSDGPSLRSKWANLCGIE